VLDGTGTVTVNTGNTGNESTLTEQRTLSVEFPGAYKLVEHERHTQGMLTLEVGTGVECLATCFTPGAE
jgi:hypothetical protein